MCPHCGSNQLEWRRASGRYVVYSTAIVRQRVERGDVVVPDRPVQRDWRLVPFGDIAARGWIEFTLANDDPLNIVDLRESGCLVLGAPTAI